MSLTLIANPHKTVEGRASNVNAAITQLPYTFKREDASFAAVQDTGDGFVTISGSSTVVAQLSVGSTVYVSFGGTTYTAGIYTVTVKVDANRFTINLAFVDTSAPDGYWNNISDRPDYSVQIKFEDVLNQAPILSTFVYKTSQSGDLFIDVGAIIGSVMEQRNIPWFEYRIVYRENWNGVDLGFTSDVDILAILGEQPIGREGGSSMKRYQMDTGEKGLLLSNFKKARAWPTWTTKYSYIMDSLYAARSASAGTKTVITTRDINGGFIGQSDTDLNTDLTPRVLTLIVPVNHPATVKLVDVFISVFEGATRVSVIDQYELTEECANPIMITWINSLGAPEYYLFDISQDVILSADAGLTYEPAVQEDVENVNKPLRRINSDEILKIICSAEVPVANIRAMHEIKTSEDVRVFLTKDGTKEIGVTINEGFETAYNTDDYTVEFNVIIEFPKDYDFFSIKEY